jgi:hypothetical protein
MPVKNVANVANLSKKIVNVLALGVLISTVTVGFQAVSAIEQRTEDHYHENIAISEKQKKDKKNKGFCKH